MSDSVRCHRRQPTRLPRPWGSPGKNTGVACHFLLQCRKVKSESEVSQSCPTLSNPKDCSLPGPSVYGIFQARVLEWGAIAFSGHSLLDEHKDLGWDGPPFPNIKLTGARFSCPGQGGLPSSAPNRLRSSSESTGRCTVNGRKTLET